MDILHSVINVFASGRSYAKIYLVFAYFVIFCVYYYFFKNVKIKKVERIFFYSLVLSYALGLFLFLFYCFENNISYKEFILTFSNDESSSTQLSHNHLLKGSLALIYLIIGVGKLENVDNGLAYIGQIPNTLFVIGLILLGTALISSIILISEKVRTITNKKLFLFACLLSSFIILKNSVDGGIFSATALPILMSFIYGISNNRAVWKKILLISFLYLISIVIMYYNKQFSINQDLLSYIMAGIIPSVFVCSIFYISKRQDNKTKTYLILFLFLLVLLSKPVIDQKLVNSDYDKLITKDAIGAFYDENPGFSGEKIAEIDKLKLFRMYDNLSIKEVLDKNKLIGNIYPVSIPWKTCVPTVAGDRVEFDLITNQPSANLPATKIIKDYVFSLHHQENNRLYYHASILIEPCLPRTFNLIEEFIKINFGDTFIIYNLKYRI